MVNAVDPEPSLNWTALAAVVALAIWRYLESGAGQERAGFTVAPLLTDRGHQALLEAAVQPTAGGS